MEKQVLLFAEADDEGYRVVEGEDLSIVLNVDGNLFIYDSIKSSCLSKKITRILSTLRALMYNN